MTPRATFRAIGVLIFSTAASSVYAQVPIPHLYVAPTVGVLRWDDDANAFSLDGDISEGMGIRAGYSPISAFSGEIVALTGSIDATAPTLEGAVPVALRTTQLELSLLVNFQTLVRAPIYPFLNLGVGAVFRSSEASSQGIEPAGDPGSTPEPLDDTNAAFHLGGGLRWDAGSRWGIRANFRDTFFNDNLETDGREEQVTVDSIEITASVEYRIPLGAKGPGKDRLR